MHAVVWPQPRPSKTREIHSSFCSICACIPATGLLPHVVWSRLAGLVLHSLDNDQRPHQATPGRPAGALSTFSSNCLYSIGLCWLHGPYIDFLHTLRIQRNRSVGRNRTCAAINRACRTSAAVLCAYPCV